MRCTTLPCAALRCKCHALHCTALHSVCCAALHMHAAPSCGTRNARSMHRPGCCLQPPAVVESAADGCMDPRHRTVSTVCLLLHCSHNKQTTAANSVQWTLQLLVSDARTECTGSLIRTRLARRGYRFALFSDAQGTPSLRIRVGQRGQGTRRSAARRGSVVAAIGISQNHMRLVARGRIGSGDGLLRW